MSWLLQSRGFLRSRPGKGFLIYLLLAMLLSGGIGVAFYEAKLTWFKTQKGEEKATALRLVDAFVTSYSKVRSQYLSGNAPVPATFRAHAIAEFDEARRSQESLHLRMVGFPGREIVTPPADEAMAATIRGFLGQVTPEPETRFLTVNGATVLRTVYPSIASQQSCVDCHNKLQHGAGWQLNDVMGAFVAEVPATAFLREAALTAVAVTLVLLAISGTVGFSIFRQHFAQLRHQEATQARLSDGERKFRTLVSNIPGICYRCANDPNYTIEFVSDAVEALTGYPASDFAGNRVRSLISVYHPEDLPLVVKATEEGIANRQPFTIEYRVIHKDGSIRWVHERGQPIFDERGVVTHLDGAIFDITERRQIERELQENEQKLKSILSNVPGACYRAAHDLDFTMEFISEPVADIAGYPASDFIDNRVRSFVSVIHPDDRDMVEHIAAEAIAAHRPYMIDYRLLHRDGAIRWVHEKGQGVFDDSGQLQHLDGAIFDISERRQMEEELRRALEDLRTATDRLAQQERFATIGQVAATVSHELRNPLSVVRNSLATISVMVGGTVPSIERPLERADRNIERCDRIIYDLLAFTQKRDLNRERVSIDAFAGDVLDAYSLAGIVLERDFRSCSDVAIDREAFRQVIVRLVDNAVQALQDPAWSAPTDHARRITVRTEAGGLHVRLSVIDTGLGIPPEVLPKVLEPLFTTKSFGVGLGLPTVRQIVEQHGGTIDIDTKISEGTTVTIWLPCLGQTSTVHGGASKEAVA